MYNIIYETSRRSRFDARYWMLGAGALGRPRGMVWGGRREEGSGWGAWVYLGRIHFYTWQNQYNILKLKNKIKFKKIKKNNKIKWLLEYQKDFKRQKSGHKVVQISGKHEYKLKEHILKVNAILCQWWE